MTSACTLEPGAGIAVAMQQVVLEAPEGGFEAALALAHRTAAMHLAEPMLLSWYDRDRDLESPRHASECGSEHARPGYVVYALHHGARLGIGMEGGLFVFYFLDVQG